MTRVRIGTAGWSIPRQVADRFPAEGTGLQRYAARFDAAEINTSFYRPHRRATWERWAASVPPDFRFAVKLPKAVTHVARLVDCGPALAQFADEVAGLGNKRGPVLVQLPPKLAFDAAVARAFFTLAGETLGGAIVCEPRHPSWFEPEADALLADHRIARVTADPAPVPQAALPGGWPGLAYFRLHGSPRPYWSGYEPDALQDWAARVPPQTETWVIFDNTASGRAAADALAFQPLVR
ncbi:MAG: DUF72 domain-containing protein [Pseudomonadota bacterium]